MNVSLHLCVRNDAGDHTGRVCKIDLTDTNGAEILLEMEHEPYFASIGPEGPEGDRRLLPMCHLIPADRPGGNQRDLVIGTRQYGPVHGYGTHIGSLVWDAAEVSETTARQIARDLLASEDWRAVVVREDWEDLVNGTEDAAHKMTARELEAAGQQVLPMEAPS